MEPDKIGLFGLVKRRLAWLTQRQAVLAQNIANADTPGYKPRDLKPFDFKHLVSREARRVPLEVSNPAHLAGRPGRGTRFAVETTRKPYESTPTGNAVVLEEQMMKVGATTMNHRLTTELYKKHLNMIRLALGRR